MRNPVMVWKPLSLFRRISYGICLLGLFQTSMSRHWGNLSDAQIPTFDRCGSNKIGMRIWSTLARFTNSCVFCSYSATKFVAFQTFNGPSYDLLIECLASQNPSRRDKALICLQFLISHREPRRTRKCIWLKTELRGSYVCR